MRGGARVIPPPHFAAKRRRRIDFQSDMREGIGHEAAARRGSGSGARTGASCSAAAPAAAHPHVWVTVKSQVAFTPDGKIAAVVHDWVFDEMYSSLRPRASPSRANSSSASEFAPLARENAGGLADIGYFTTLKIGGKAIDFGSVTEYWMEERPDHLVQFHVTVPLKEPTPPSKYRHAARRRSRVFHRLRIRRQRRRSRWCRRRPAARLRSPGPSRWRRATKKTLDESFFTSLAPGANFGFKMASTGHRRLPMTLAADPAWRCVWRARRLAATRERSHLRRARPARFRSAAGEGGGGRERRRDRLAARRAIAA